MATDLLTIAASGIRAARAGLDTTAQNIANADTKGYVRRSIGLAEVASPSGYARVSDLSFSGVRVEGYSRTVDAFRQSEVRRTGADAARADAELGALRNVEAALEKSGLHGAMTGFETALQKLTVDPVNPSLRAATLESARTLARTFNITGNELEAVGDALQVAATDGVTQVNRLATELGRVNLQLGRAKPGSADHVTLLDQRDSLLEQMSGYTSISASFAENHMVTVRIGDTAGPQLVAGQNTAPLAMATAADGTVSFSVGGAAASLSSGSLAGQAQGLVAARDARVQLDGIAGSLIAAANAAQTGGAALDGTPGAPLFSGSSAVTMTVALASGAGLATAPAGAAAGSRDQSGLAALRSAMAGGNFAGQVDGLLFQVSSAAQGRETTATALNTIAGAARSALDAQAGVNLDEEAANLVRYQQAFQASSKAVQVASDMFDSLLAIR